MACRIDRRSFLGKSIAAGAAYAGIRSLEEKNLLAAAQDNGARTAELRKRTASEPKIPIGKIGNLQMSRIIAGGNVISGWCHNRDLLYVSTLAGHYLTEEKQFDTLELMEEYGINAIAPDPTQLAIINKYKQQRGGALQTVVGVRQDWEHLNQPFWSGMKEWIDRSIDDGATTMYTQGGFTEHAMKTGKPELIDVIARAVAYIKEKGFLAGLGCHDVKVIEVADEYGIEPDYYFKTFHRDNYWSAHPREKRVHWSVDAERSNDHNEFHDNIFDLFPDRTRELMAKKAKPWIAFKTLAAGAIHPESAFEFCFKGGADFLAVGMFDFQVIENTVIANRVLAMDDVQNRSRPWRA
ncbi:MAG: hypothetical protein JW993_19740 [Sedimentisphaerales bacterium]|nr:hypothetical protein [Sedimentisphaerales bacterium]